MTYDAWKTSEREDLASPNYRYQSRDFCRPVPSELRAQIAGMKQAARLIGYCFGCGESITNAPQFARDGAHVCAECAQAWDAAMERRRKR